MFKSQLKYRIKSLILVLTSTNISVIIILQIKKAQLMAEWLDESTEEAEKWLDKRGDGLY